jgi:hypothetical protein
VENLLVNRHVFISERTGDKIDISSMQTEMQRLTTMAEA